MSKRKENGLLSADALNHQEQSDGQQEDGHSNGDTQQSNKEEPQQRAAELQYLVKRFIIQLRYGCEGPICTAPHCLTCKTRIATKPIRKPNIYTARMQAYTLACSRDPYACLCSNQPKISLEDYDSLEDAIDTSLAGKHQKDEKSLVQSLFSTKAFRDFERLKVEQYRVREDEKLWWEAPLRFQSLRDTSFMLQAFRHPEKKWSAEEELFRLKSPGDHWKIIWVFAGANRQRDLIFNNLWHAAGNLFPSPLPKLPGFNSANIDPDESCTTSASLSDDDAAHIIMICLHALYSNLTAGLAWCERRTLRPFAMRIQTLRHSSASIAAAHQAETSYPPALRLLDRLVRAIAARRCHWEITELPRSMHGENFRSNASVKFPLMEKVLGSMKIIKFFAINQPENGVDFTRPAGIADWMESFIKQNWQGEVVVSRWSAVGGALEFLNDMCKWADSEETAIQRLTGTKAINAGELNLEIPANNPGKAPIFRSKILDVDRVDPDFSMSWAEHVPNPNTRHLLEFPFLFSDTLSQHFRTINYANMFMAYRTAGFVSHMSHHLDRLLTDSMLRHLHKTLKTATARYLMLDLRREHMLEDAFDQLRGREKRELLRPLKVRIGIAEGMEIGVDQGGVAQEFFRLVFHKAFDPDYGGYRSLLIHS